MATGVVMDGAIAAAAVIITDGAEVIAVITMDGRAVAIAAGTETNDEKPPQLAASSFMTSGAAKRNHSPNCVTV
jgi:hypothetical protein